VLVWHLCAVHIEVLPMRTRRSHGITLIELAVIILIVGLLLGFFLPAVQSAREAGRRTQCANNMRNIGLALVNFSTSKNRFPSAGTFYDDPAVHEGDPLKSSIYRAIVSPGAKPGDADSWLYSWVIDTYPYLDCADCYNAWDKRKPYLSSERSNPRFSEASNGLLARAPIGIMRCPDDSTAPPGQGNLSYVVNGGFARWHAVPVGWSGNAIDGKATNGGILQWMPPGGTWQDNQAICKKLGVMFLGTQTGDQPWDIATRAADITDGMSNTLLVAENTLAGYSKGTPYSGGRETNWACPLPNFTMFLASDDVCRTPRSAGDCPGGQLAPGPKQTSGKGWSRANQKGTFENMNYGQQLTVEGSFPFASSGHPGGANFVFCDGAVRFLSSAIDGKVYAEIMTPAGMRLPSEIRQGVLDVDDFAY
jgi:prepilin-type processing-associated H-X9-DG protein